MTHEMIPHDTALISGVQLQLVSPTAISRARPSGAAPSAAAAPSATELTNIDFQFPPKLKDDSRGGLWKEENTGPRAGDPIAVYEHGEPRKITLEWSYIVGAGPRWGIDRIKRQLSLLRFYFVGGAITGLGDVYGVFAVRLRVWRHGGASPMSYRLHSASIKHGDAMVGAGNTAFHLRTDVSIQLRSWPVILGVQLASDQVVTPPDWY